MFYQEQQKEEFRIETKGTDKELLKKINENIKKLPMYHNVGRGQLKIEISESADNANIIQFNVNWYFHFGKTTESKGTITCDETDGKNIVQITCKGKNFTNRFLVQMFPEILKEVEVKDIPTRYYGAWKPGVAPISAEDESYFNGKDISKRPSCGYDGPFYPSTMRK